MVCRLVAVSLGLGMALSGCSAAPGGSTPTGSSSGGASSTSSSSSGGSTSSSGGGAGDYAAFGNEMPVTIMGYSGEAMEPFLSRDGTYLFFNNSNDPSVDTDLFYAVRIDGLNFQFQGPIQGANSAALDAVASLDVNGNFYFVSTRSYASSLSTIHTAQFSGGALGPVSLVQGVSLLTAGQVNFDAEISADGNTLWFDDGTYAGGPLSAANIVVADRQGAAFVRRSDSATILQSVNSGGLNYAPDISSDGLELFFTRWDRLTPGAVPAIYRAARTSASAPFAMPQRVSVATGFVEAASLSADGHFLYYHKRDNGQFRIFRAER